MIIFDFNEINKPVEIIKSKYINKKRAIALYL